MVLMNLFAGRNRDAKIEYGLVDMVGGREGVYFSRFFCANWQSEPKIYMYMQRVSIV